MFKALLLSCVVSLTFSYSTLAGAGSTMASGPAIVLNPTLGTQGEPIVPVMCVCTKDTTYPNQIHLVVRRGDPLTDRAVRYAAPLLVQAQAGGDCEAICSGNRCLGGIVKLSGYNPDFTSSRTHLPELVFISGHASETNTSACTM